MNLTLIFANLGRGTADQARRSWQSLADNAKGVDLVLPVEVDEGDTGYSDHQLMRSVFPAKAWPAVAFATHEPILTRTGLALRRSGRVWAGPAVRHQSPRRGITYTIVGGHGGPDIEVCSTHFAAGYRNGSRPPLVKAALGVSWNLTRARLKARARRAHNKGRHFIVCADTNDRGFKPLHPAEIRLFASGPDLGVVIPAKGWTVEHTATTVPTFIEKLHQGHKVQVRFTKEKP